MLLGSALAMNANKHWVLCSEPVRKQIERVFDTLRGKDTVLSREKFHVFLTTMQGITDPEPLQYKDYTVQEFHYVWSKTEAAWGAVRKLRGSENDLKHPISNYFISSSHNTYLEGNQLKSKSSAEAYRKVLKNGCRCIEIDVWNGTPSRSPSKSPHPEHRRHLSSASIVSTLGNVKQAITDRTNRHSRVLSANSQTLSPAMALERESSTTLDPDPKDLTERLKHSSDSSKTQGRVEPIVHHHNTMTTTVPFREVCRAIKESAFVTNPLPLIVSLEVGADREQQELMVEIMKEEWGDLLLDKPYAHVDPHERQPLLEELERKILIKVKRLDDSTVDPDKPDQPDRGRTLAVNSKPPICEKLAKLAIYTHSEHFEDRDSLSSRTPSHIFSLSEDRFTNLVQAKKEICNQFFLHNRNFFMRIYPKGLRVDSSNPDPSFHWRRGVQMVAMNWQKTDEGMMLNDAMFANTNGWVLKPTGYLTRDTSDFEAIPKRTINLRITILAGQYLPLPEEYKERSAKNLQARVKVELHVEKQSRSLECVHETPHEVGEHPVWDKSGVSFEFFGVAGVLEQMSFVRYVAERGDGCDVCGANIFYL